MLTTTTTKHADLQTMKFNGGVQLIGTSKLLAELRSEIEHVGRSGAKVLITGESGVGKEVVARAIAAASPRPAATFIPVIGRRLAT